MSKRFMLLLILANIFFGLLYLFSSYLLWEEMNNWYDYNMQSTWTPFFVYPHRIPNLPTVMMPVQKMLNLPFIVFCISVVTNSVIVATYFLVIPRLQKSASIDI